MNRCKGRMLWVLLILMLVVSGGLLVSCKMDDDESEGQDYATATAAVDYTTADPGKAVFIDFSSKTVVKELPHDFFDIAIGSGRDSTVHIIANSGSYGTGVKVLKTESTNIADDFSAQAGNITAYTFKDGKAALHDHQTVANPLAGASGSGAAKNVYLVKTQYGSAEAKHFKVVFDSYGPMGQCKITVVPGLGGGDTGKKELTSSISEIADGYGYIFFDLHGDGSPRALNDGNALKEGVDLPKAADWDLLCTRTDDIDDNGDPRGRSSILLNTVKGVEAATETGKFMEDVLAAEGLAFSAEIDAIGYGWYYTDNRGDYWVSKEGYPIRTFVVKTAEGHYAKFQPASFYGPDMKKGPGFHMEFRYHYVANNKGVFDK